MWGGRADGSSVAVAMRVLVMTSVGAISNSGLLSFELILRLNVEVGEDGDWEPKYGTDGEIGDDVVDINLWLASAALSVASMASRSV